MAKLGWLKLIEPLKLTWVNKDCVQSLRLLGPILLIFTGVGLRWVVGGEGLIGRVGRVGLVGDDNQS